MVILTAIRTRPPISSPRSPVLVPSRSPSSSPARDKVTLTAPMMIASAKLDRPREMTERVPGEVPDGDQSLRCHDLEGHCRGSGKFPLARLGSVCRMSAASQ
jgi:hypothetical protein